MFRDVAYNLEDYTHVCQEFINEVINIERRFGSDEAFDLHEMAQNLFNRDFDIDQKLEVVYDLIDFIKENSKSLGVRTTRMLGWLNQLLRMLE